MSSQAMKIPGPDHPITIAPNPKRVVVTWNGHVVADSRKALTLNEASYPAVFYIPRIDVDMALLTRSTHKSFCPYKGEASYYSITSDGKRSENAIWSYEDPSDAVCEIKGHLAFYPDRVDSIEKLPV
ncbi:MULTISPECIES: DUF427 domain-containing protein [unclassified Rhizobium]|uniref:DUF427 domain-containing protein n=1 Tax=unclassified Rhizobium TaxID=2613769 RepID=UPI001AD98E2F|nr:MULTISPECIES: DUF427 domain-containing protein [unclassified Rhizobium]MBO9124907.1 DUF427 domain-containing protein [Rhizobium sp. 16-488-2b]MBO9175492.1 DUF427 domain-containing protein [Rhizobium sp. 16-488-2a]